MKTPQQQFLKICKSENLLMTLFDSFLSQNQCKLKNLNLKRGKKKIFKFSKFAFWPDKKISIPILKITRKKCTKKSQNITLKKILSNV